METAPFASLTGAAFVVIPVVLVLLLLWATARAYPDRGIAMVVRVGVIALAWMALTWMAASRGVFRQWNATPPPFAFLVLSIVAMSCVIALTPFGRRLATAVPL